MKTSSTNGHLFQSIDRRPRDRFERKVKEFLFALKCVAAAAFRSLFCDLILCFGFGRLPLDQQKCRCDFVEIFVLLRFVGHSWELCQFFFQFFLLILIFYLGVSLFVFRDDDVRQPQLPSEIESFGFLGIWVWFGRRFDVWTISSPCKIQTRFPVSSTPAFSNLNACFKSLIIDHYKDETRHWN